MGCSAQKPKKDFKFSTIPIQGKPSDDMEEWIQIISKQTKFSPISRSGFSKSKTMSVRCHPPLEQIDEEEV